MAGTARLRRTPQPPRRSMLLGVLSISGFVLHWVLLLIAFGVAMQGLSSGTMAGVQSGVKGAIGLSVVAMAMPVLGFLCGLIGCFLETQQRVLAGIGAGLNVLALLLMFAR